MKKQTKKILGWAGIGIGVVILGIFLYNYLAVVGDLIYVDNIQGAGWLNRNNPFTFNVRVEQGANGNFLQNISLKVSGGDSWTKQSFFCSECTRGTPSCPGASVHSTSGGGNCGDCRSSQRCNYYENVYCCKKNEKIYYDWKKVECKNKEGEWVIVFDFNKGNTYTGLSDNIADIVNNVCYSQITSRIEEYHDNDCVISCRGSASNNLGQMGISITGVQSYSDPCEYEAYEEANYLKCHPECKDLYWIDDEHVVCSTSQKKVICPADEYEGLHTFETLQACQEYYYKDCWKLTEDDTECTKFSGTCDSEGEYLTEENCLANAKVCLDAPEKPCDGAVWRDYPTCEWDTSGCSSQSCDDIPALPCEGAVWLEDDCKWDISDCDDISYCDGTEDCEGNQYCTTEDGDCFSGCSEEEDVYCADVCYGYCKSKSIININWIKENIVKISAGAVVAMLVIFGALWLMKKKK